MGLFGIKQPREKQGDTDQQIKSQIKASHSAVHAADNKLSEEELYLRGEAAWNRRAIYILSALAIATAGSIMLAKKEHQRCKKDEATFLEQKVATSVWMKKKFARFDVGLDTDGDGRENCVGWSYLQDVTNDLGCTKSPLEWKKTLHGIRY